MVSSGVKKNKARMGERASGWELAVLITSTEIVGKELTRKAALRILCGRVSRSLKIL